MAYVNCALCPAQAYLYGHHHYENGDAFAEYRCLSKHKTFIEEGGDILVKLVKEYQDAKCIL